MKRFILLLTPLLFLACEAQRPAVKNISEKKVSVSPPPEVCSDTLRKDNKVMTSERINGLAIGDKESKILNIFGKAKTLGPGYFSAIDGEFYQKWTYADGLEVMMRIEGKEDPDAPKKKPSKVKVKTKAFVSSIYVKGKSTAKTRFGVGIGSSEKEALASYALCEDPETPKVKGRILAGSPYEAVRIVHDSGKVVSIFVGALAE